MKDKTKLWGAVLIAIAAIALLYFVVDDYLLSMRQRQILAEVESTTQPTTATSAPVTTTEKESTTIATTTTESETTTETTTETTVPEMIKGEDGLLYLGRIRIPSIDLNMPLVEGTTDTDIAVSAGHMIGTAYPDQIGNCVIVGHRGYSRGRLFNRLDEMKSGDEIITKVSGVETTYVVYETKVVEPTDTSVINQTDDYKVLTLITCTPLYSSDYRIVIHALKRSEQ